MDEAGSLEEADPLDAAAGGLEEAYAEMAAGLEAGQQVVLQLPAEAQHGADTVIMEVVSVDGNQIHFIAPDGMAGGADVPEDGGAAQQDLKTQDVLLDLPQHAAVFSSSAQPLDEEDEDDMEEVEVSRCFLCRRPAGPQRSLTLLILGRTSFTACSLAERLAGCAAPLKLEATTTDGVCADCLLLINQADQHYHQYQLVSEKIAALVGETEAAAAGQSSPPRSDAAAAGPPSADTVTPAVKRETPADGDDSDDADWTPSGPVARSSRSRAPKVPRRWSPEPIERRTPPPPAPAGIKRGRGRPRKHPPPTVIEYSDIETLKEQVREIGTEEFIQGTKSDQKSDLERIIHLEVRAADVSAASPPPEQQQDQDQQRPAGGGGRVSTYECRRCDIVFADSSEMVKHLRKHVKKPWCKRCRTEFPSRQAIVEHRRACRLQHRSGLCEICDRQVPFLRHHMKRHSQLVEQGQLDEGAPLPEEADLPPPSAQRRVGKFLAGGVCSICGKHVATKLRKHERTHNVTHVCPICKKVFTREDVVRGHIKRVHMKERPHVCPQCGKTFVSVYSLQRHEMIHNNEYRFYCQECGDGFRQKQQLTAHMRHKHGVVDVVFEDVEVMPEGAAVVDALISQHGTIYQGAVLRPADQFHKEEFVIATAGGAGDGEHVQFTAVEDAAGALYRAELADGDHLDP